MAMQKIPALSPLWAAAIWLDLLQPQPAKGGGTVTPPAVMKEIPRQEPLGERSIHEETVQQVQHSAEAPPIAAGMPPANQIRRFSKNNPANLEVFRRNGSRIEALEKMRWIRMVAGLLCLAVLGAGPYAAHDRKRRR